MRRHSALISVPNAPSTLLSVEVNMPQSGGESGRLEAFGEAFTARQVSLSATIDGLFAGMGIFYFFDSVAPTDGRDGSLSRIRGLTLQDYSALFDEPVASRGAIGLPPQPPRYRAVLYDIDKPLGSDLPDGEECEEKRRSGTVRIAGVAQTALQLAGMDINIIPGPGFISGDVDDDYSVRNKTVGQVLNERLFTNGVRWWLEGDLVVVDGRALPQGSFDVPVSDRLDVAENSWSDSFAASERAPELSDYIARCAESLQTEDPEVTGTFETNDSGVYNFFEESGSLGFGSNQGDYATVKGRVTKADGQIVSRFEEGRGYKSVPATLFGGTQQLGPTYIKTLDNTFHSTVREALTQSVERTRTYADMAVLQGLEPGDGNSTDLQRTLFSDLQRQSPYISEEKVVRQRWNAEGLLRRRSEITREFSGVAVQDVAGVVRVRLLYKDGLKVETWTPSGGGKYEYYASGYTMVDQAVYEETEDGSAAPEPVGIVTNRIPFSFREETDSPPPSVSIPLPTCEEVDSCLVDAEKEYLRDLADWQARQVNNASRRMHTVRFNCLKLSLNRGQLYGNGYVTDVTHSLARETPGSTTVTVITAL